MSPRTPKESAFRENPDAPVRLEDAVVTVGKTPENPDDPPAVTRFLNPYAPQTRFPPARPDKQ